MKKIIKIALGFFVLIMIMGAIGGDSSEDNSAVDATVEPEENTPLQEASAPNDNDPLEPVAIEETEVTPEYQDLEWIDSCQRNIPILSDDLTKMSHAASNEDLVNVRVYGRLLASDSQNAISDNKLYTVSPDLQQIQNKYTLAIVDFYESGTYAADGAEEMQYGDMDKGVKYFETATVRMKSAGEYLTQTTILLDEYNKNLI